MTELWNELSYRPPKPPPRKKRGTPKRDLEGAVLRECLKWLRDQPWVAYVERRNTGEVMFEGGGRVAFGRKGAADIWCLVRGTLYEVDIPADVDSDDFASRVSDHFIIHHVEIECKRRSGGRLSPAQQEFRQLCRQNTVPYLVVTSAEDLAKKFKTLNLTD